MNNKDVILRLKKTIVFTDKILLNFPKNEIVLKTRISNCLFDVLELSYFALVDQNNRNDYLKKVLTKLKMLDFYIVIAFDKNIMSHKNVKNLSLHLREITSLFYGWLNKTKNETI